MRQAKLNASQVKVMPWEEEKFEDVKNDDEFENKKRKDESEEVEKTNSTAENSAYLKSTPLDGIEMTDEQSTRMERLMNAMESNMKSTSNKNGNSGVRGGRKR